MSKKKAKKPSVRRDPYVRALETAQRRLEKALSERTRCEERLVALNQEIPRLQNIISVFEPGLTNQERQETTAPAKTNGLGIPAHLERYLHPNAPVRMPAAVQAVTRELESEDQTLVDPFSEKGTEILS